MTDVFGLDEDGQKAQDDFARFNPVSKQDTLPAWQGLGQAAKGLMYASAQAGRSLTVAGAAIPVAAENLIGGITGDYSSNWSDWYFKNVTESVGENAVDAWRPDASQMGSATKMLNVGSQLVGSLPQIIGTPSLYLSSQALDTSTEVIRQGGSIDAAMGAGGINLAANAVGFKIPAAFGSTLAQRVGSGAAANFVTGAAADAGTAAVLQADGLDQMAESYKWNDPTARGMDILLGAAFGYKAHLDAPNLIPRAERDAILTANNHDSFNRRSAPGIPMDAAAAREHAANMNQALQQLADGAPVNVDGGGNFALRPEAGVAANLTGYEAMLVALESGGRADARAPGSSATGLHQFTNATWLGTVRKAAPAWAEGMTDAQILELRTDPSKSAQMERVLRAENTSVLEANGVTVEPTSLYAMHHFGQKGGVKFAKAAGDTPMESILTKGQIDANPYLKGLTKDQAIANWETRAARAGVDIQRPADAAPIDIAPRTAAEAGQIIDDRLATLENLSSMDRMTPPQIEALRAEDQQITAQMRVNERRVSSGVIPADPRAMLTETQLQDMTNRRIEIRQQIERHNAAMGYENQLRDIRSRLDKADTDRQIMAIAERLAPAPRQQRPSMERAPQQAAPRTSPEPAPASVSNPEQGKQTPAGGRPQEQPRTEPVDSPVASAARIAEQTPDLQIPMGVDENGTPRFQTATEFMAEVQAERSRAETDARAYTAAVNCFLRLGG